MTACEKNSPEIGILLATYCEAQNIERLITEIESMSLDAQILIIDDSSPDGTAGIVSRLKERYPNLSLLIRPCKLGLGTAITEGFRFFLSSKVIPKKIIVMDADYSHNPEDIPLLLSNLGDTDGLVIGSRYCLGGRIYGWSINRRLISRIANYFARSITGLKVNDCTSGFRCYSVDFLKSAIDKLHCTTYEIQIETVRQSCLHGYKIKEVPVLFINRKQGKSKLTATEISGFIFYILKIIHTKHRRECKFS